MILARVVGRSWATVKHPALEGLTVFAVQPVDPQGQPASSSFLAIDRVGACPGQLVLVLREGSGSRQIMGADDQPYHSLVIGIVDDVHDGDSDP